MARYLLTNKEIYDVKKNNLIYKEFLNFKEIFFEKGVSFFDSNIKLFDNNEVFEEYEKRIIKNYDDSSLKSIDKYSKQIKNSNKKFRHFFACIFWLYNYPILDKKSSTKMNEIEKYLGEYFHGDLKNIKIKYKGLAKYGLLSQYIYYDINFIYFFIKRYIQSKENPNTIINNINLYNLMKEISDEDFKNMKKLSSKNMLNYLFNPDEYEPIIDTSCKKKIVKHYFGKVDEDSLDRDILRIRKEITGFENSLYYDICVSNGNIQNNHKVAIVENITAVKEKKEFNFSLSSKNYKDDNLITKYEKQIENGLNAELLVYEEIKEEIDKKVLMTELGKLLGNNKFNEINSSLDKLIHYSKNIDMYAPFDILSTRGQELIFIEVKSTTSNQIYFSRSELEFAYKNIDKYVVKVVKDNEIYDISLEEVITEFQELNNKIDSFSIDTIKLKINFNEFSDE